MASEKPLLILFDGHALIHRAFHAMRDLSTKKGQPTGAVYGFAMMLLKTLHDFNPEYCAVAFDSAAPTFRHEQFKEYKAHRPEAPAELIPQFGLVRELVQTFNIPSFEMEGYEADDILGTISRQAAEINIDTIIVTGDTDILQLVNPRIKVLLPRPRKSFSDTQLYDETAVHERYGLSPQQIVDMKGLKGDPSDNIPGVPGIGEKTAQKLISQFGSIEQIYERINSVTPPKLQEKLRVNESAARQSKELATIIKDIPIKLDLPSCNVCSYNREKVVELLRSLEFYSLLDKLPLSDEKDLFTSPVTSAPQNSYKIIDNVSKLDELINEISRSESIAFDTETTSKYPRDASLVGISLSTEKGKAWYIPVGHITKEPQLSLSEITEKLQPILKNPKIIKIAHNAKYDITVLNRHDLIVKNQDFDTMIAAHLLGEQTLGLKPLAFTKLGIEMTPISDLIGSGAKQISMAEVTIEQTSEYACADADMTFRLYQVMKPELKKEGLWDLFSNLEMPLLYVLHKMESNGIVLDTTLLEQMSKDLTMDIDKIENEIYVWVGHEFNINSSQQLGKVLFDELKLPPSRKTKSGYSTDAGVLEGLRGTHPVVNYVLDYRQLSKLKSTYVDALPLLVNPETGRIHTSFNQTVTTTGRLSSSDPNLQNIPIRTDIGKKIRQAFIAPEDGYSLLGADYSQIELRVMAHLSQDPGLITAFANDEDIHTATASLVFNVPASEVTAEMRRIAKVVNFGVSYGMSDYGLEQATNFSRKEASDFINSYFAKYSGIKKYLESTKQFAIENGYVETLMGRRRYIPDIKSSNYQSKQAAERMALNMPVQGTAADIIKLAMIKIQQELDSRKLKSKMILQVHDELLFEVPNEELEIMKKLVADIMTKATKFSVPLKVDIKVGRNWGETH